MTDLRDAFTPPPSVGQTERSAAFQQIKPICVSLSTSILTSTPNPRDLNTHLTALHTTLTSLPAHILDLKFADYIFFPLSHIFRQYRALPDRTLELALECVRVLITTAWRAEVPHDLARQLLILLTFIVGGPPGQDEKNKPPPRAEETLLVGVRCLEALFGALSRTREKVVDREDNLPAMGHTMEVLLGTLKAAEMLQLQTAVMAALRALLLETVRDRDVLASFYPGVVSALVKVVGTGRTSKRPYLVLAEVVKVLDGVVAKILADAEVERLAEEEEDGGEGLKIKRSKPWARLTAKNTKVALEQVLKLRTHPRVEVRKAVFEMCRNLLEKAPKTLVDTLPSLVESLVVLAGDEDEGVKSLAGSTVRVMAAVDTEVKEAVRGCLERWIGVLPRVMTGNDEDAKQRVIARLALAFGMCEEMGMETELFRDMLAESIKESLFTSTAVSAPKSVGPAPPAATQGMQLQVLNSSPDAITKPGGFLDFPEVLTEQRSQYETMSNMKSLLSRLGSSSDNALSLAQRYLRETQSPAATPPERAVSLWVSLQLLRGSLDLSNELDLYFELDLGSSSSRQRRVTDELLSLSLNILEYPADTPNPPLQCLALESVSLIAETQKRQFRSQLIEALYPVVHHLGDPSPAVQNHAVITLNNITRACEYTDTKELIMENVDYMINAVSLKLNIFDLTPQAPVVLNMMLKLAGPRLVPFCEDLVENIFDMLAGYHENQQLVEDLFTVLKTVVEEAGKDKDMAKAIEAAKDPSDKEQPAHVEHHILTDAELLQILRDVCHPKQPDDETPGDFPRKPWGPGKQKQKQKSFQETLAEIEAEDAENPDPDTAETAPPPPEPDTPELPKTYKLITKIVDLCQHYATHDSLVLRHLVLSLLTIATAPLAKHPDSYLPLLSTLWPLVLARIHDPEPAIVAEALKCVAALVTTAGDFAARRVEEAWGEVRRVYEKAVREDKGAWSGGAKVRREVRGLVEGILAGVRVKEEVLGGVVEVAVKEGVEGEVVERVAGDEVWLEKMGRRGGGRWRVPRWREEVFRVPVF